MREKKNILICVGAALSTLPLIKYLIDFICSVLLQKTITGYNILAMLVNVLFFVFVVILAVVQICNNCKCSTKRTIPIVGIVVSGLLLLADVSSLIEEYQRYIIYKSLDLVTIQYFIAAFVSNFLVLAITGHILLLIGYIKSISVGK